MLSFIKQHFAIKYLKNAIQNILLREKARECFINRKTNYPLNPRVRYPWQRSEKCSDNHRKLQPVRFPPIFTLRNIAYK